VDLLHRSPEAVVVAERLVDQVQVDVVETETLEGSAEGGLRIRLAAFWIDSFVVPNNCSRGMPLLRRARPTASSFP
jgi:hypothetical protein